MKRRGRHDDGRDDAGRGEGRDYTEFGFQELGKAEAMDRYLDGEIDRDSATFRSAFVKREFRERLSEMEETLGELRKPLRGPDLTAIILDGVDARKPFVAKRTRRFVTAGRLAAAACVLLAVGAVVVFERANPGAMKFVDEPTPIAGVIHASTAAHSAPAHDAGRGEGRGERQGDDLLRWSLARLSDVRSVEVRPSRPSWERGSDRGFDHGAEAGTVVTAGMTSVGMAERRGWWLRDRTAEPATGFATFPVLDGSDRPLFAVDR